MFTKRTKVSLIKGIITKRSPIYVQYAVAKNCNLRCKMCGSFESRDGEKELSILQIRKLARVLDKLNAGIILLTGGEPFIREDLAEIISIFSSLGFTVRLQTNGILATEDKIKAAYAAGMKEVTISLHSLSPQMHDAITGSKDSWHKAIEAIARFSQILPPRDAVIGVNTLVCRENIKELPEIIKFVTRIGFYISLIPIHASVAVEEDFIIRKNSPEFCFKPEESRFVEDVYKEVLNMKSWGYNIYNSYKFLRNSPVFLTGGRPDWRCDSPDLYFAISPSGKFLPCVDIQTSISMLDDNFCDRYYSGEIRRAIRKQVENCCGCFYPCWPEMTFLCRDPLVLAERILLGLKAKFKKRVPVTAQDCFNIINKIKKS